MRIILAFFVFTASAFALKAPSHAAVQAEAGITAIRSQYLRMFGEVNSDSEAADVQFVCLNQIFFDWGDAYVSTIGTTKGLSEGDITSYSHFVSQYTAANDYAYSVYEKFRKGITAKVQGFISAARMKKKWPVAAKEAGIKLDDIRAESYKANLESCTNPEFYKGIDSGLGQTYDQVAENKADVEYFKIADMKYAPSPAGVCAVAEKLQSASVQIASGPKGTPVASQPPPSRTKETLTLRAAVDTQRKMMLGK